MGSSLIQGLFSLLTDNIFLIMYLLAALQIYLIVSIFMLIKQHEGKLFDAANNLVKGFKDAPDRDSAQNISESINASLQYITSKIASNPTHREEFKKNAGKVNERPTYSRHYKIEIFASVMSTLVQVFPLLGILGTILAIAATAFEPGSQIDAASVSSAFVLAMDTTILGISFSVLFMIVESTFQPKIERVIHESNEYRHILSNIYFS